MSDNQRIQSHPAHQHATPRVRGNCLSYYLQVLHQNLHHFYEQVPSGPCEVDEQEVLRGTVFMVEEAIEYSSSKTLEGKFDALVDIVIVALGRAAFHGFHQFDEAMERVIDANKQKIPGPSPGRGEWSRDLSKPEGWKPADLTDLVQPVHISNLVAINDKALRGQDDSKLSDDNKNFAVSADFHWRRLIADRDRLEEQLEAAREERGAAQTRCQELEDLSHGLLVERDRLWKELDTARRVSPAGMEDRHAMHPVLVEAAQLLIKKSLDYGSAMDDYSKATYMPFGHHSYIHMLHTKLGRIRSVSGVDGHGKDRKVNFESLRDSVIDLINYGAFYAAWLDEQETINDDGS